MGLGSTPVIPTKQKPFGYAEGFFVCKETVIIKTFCHMITKIIL